MKLEVGMYVRAEYGIDKIKDIVLNGSFYEDSGLYLEKNGKILCGKEAMKDLKASHTLLGNDEEPCLIEVGDYVNGYKVINVCNGEYYPSGKFVDIDCDKPSNESYFFEKDIKSIVTKEMFSSVEYRVETN